MVLAYDAVFFDLYGTLVDDAGDAVEGARELIERLSGVRWAVVTSCPRRLAEVLLTSAGIAMPQVLVGAEDVAHNKPAPDGYLLAARRMNVDPKRGLAVEDSVSGIDAARAAGMDVIGIVRGRTPEIVQAATFTVKRLAALELTATAGAVELNAP